MTDKMTVEEMMAAAEHGTLPEGFGDWDARDDAGVSVAEVAAMYGNLPADYPDWDKEVPGDGGITLAHLAAAAGGLPSGFSRWDIHDGSSRLSVGDFAGYLARSGIGQKALPHMVAGRVSTSEFGIGTYYELTAPPPTVQAVRVGRHNFWSVAGWIVKHGGRHPEDRDPAIVSYTVETPSGPVTASLGDWIVMDADGFRVCPDREFRADYRRVGGGVG
ncbi:MAG: hypothetical protein LBR80_04225 [Deltaproteobacteria bacterium]|jgi:hypothetical protein|nr:hypothetical protein [Deltaproteobacteria bacterium]